jgi:tellurite resistance protein
MTEQVSPQEALIYVMTTMCVADRGLDQVELRAIRFQVEQLPVFAGFDIDRLPTAVNAAASVLSAPDGIARIIALAALSLPLGLHETAYALAVEIAAADVEAKQEELRLLELIRDGLDLSPLAVAAIEHSARVRYRVP